MKRYRENIIKQIIYSPESFSLGPLIDNNLRMLIEKGIHVILIVRILDNLKTSLREIMRGELSDRERNNIKQALNLLKDYDIKKLTRATIKQN